MREFKGKVAVITGAASGIGRGLAERCAREGMRVVLADIEGKALSRAESELRAAGAAVLAVPTDVSQERDVQALAERALDAFGAVHLLCNNAGVAIGSTVWETTVNDWRWVLGVNLWGVIHGARVFIPIMLGQDSEGHIVNTASIQGLLSHHPLTASYQVSKHAVVALSEQLHHELAGSGAKIRVSVLCPGWVKTQIGDSGRNRPEALRNDAATRFAPAIEQAYLQVMQAIEDGSPPEQVADSVFAAIREETFYILPHPEWKPAVRTRMQDILDGRNPTIPCL
jgi:NAD(P)-dependent dehydrogenase (short-subunit alcohol dehydrogenase family)